MKKCFKCEKTIPSHLEDKYVAYDMQHDLGTRNFCSLDCLQSWVQGKTIGMGIALGIGVILAIAMLTQNLLLEITLALFGPYMIRRLASSIGMADGFELGQILLIIVGLVGAVSAVYPIYAIYKEITTYSAMKRWIAAERTTQTPVASTKDSNSEFQDHHF